MQTSLHALREHAWNGKLVACESYPSVPDRGLKVKRTGRSTSDQGKPVTGARRYSVFGKSLLVSGYAVDQRIICDRYQALLNELTSCHARLLEKLCLYSTRLHKLISFGT